LRVSLQWLHILAWVEMVTWLDQLRGKCSTSIGPHSFTRG